jgi:hypothetical protein
MTESNASESPAGTNPEELKAWYANQLNRVVKEMVRAKAISGAAVDAVPVWMVPQKILIAKINDSSQKAQFIWTISGSDFATDHIPGSLAKTPRDAARHFSLKWQLDADRYLEMAKGKAPGGNPEPHLEAHAQNLIKHAEALYDLTMVDDFWKEV